MQAKWPFHQPENMVVISLRSIVFGGAPILHVIHDQDDDGWQFLGAGTPDPGDACLVALSEIVQLDPTIRQLSDLPPGWHAWRQASESPWCRDEYRSKKTDRVRDTMNVARFLDTLGRILQKPLFGTRVIPRDAAVDPRLFPDEEFPIGCERCGYLLRGLPDGKCPECGTEFVRAQRLVQQYVFGKGQTPWKRSLAIKWCNRLLIAAVVIILLPMLSLIVLALVLKFRFGSSGPQATNMFMIGMDAILIIIRVSFTAGPALVLGSAVLAFSVLKRQLAKRRAVVRAIPAARRELMSKHPEV